MTLEKLLTTREVADALGRPIEYLRRVRREGHIEAVNLGTPKHPVWAYRPSAVEAFLTARTHGTH